MAMADLHVHSTISDGSEGMEQILSKAKRGGISHISFTNHDTTRDAFASVELAKKYGIKAFPGVEMSAQDPATGKKVHILGYCFSSVDFIEQIGQETLKKRHALSLKQMEILEDLGYHIEEQVILSLGSGVIYKQHILDYLHFTGQSKELYGDTYQLVFKNNGPCHMDLCYPDAREVVLAIAKAGGVPVLAHVGQQDNFYLIPKLIEVGLRGLERNHPSHTDVHKARIDAICKGYGLMQTAGSDYHGRYEQVFSPLGSQVLHVAPKFNDYLTSNSFEF